MDEARSLPAGTVTFLLTDIESSTRLWEEQPEPMRAALARHDALAAALIVQHSGFLIKSRGEGDSLFAVFARADDALAAACALQQAFLTEPWPTPVPLRVRMALHTDTAELREGDYYGPGVNRCARLRAVAHGGQVLLSQTTRDLVESHRPEGVKLRDLGVHRLKDLQQPERLFQLLSPNLPADFPPLRSLESFAHNLPAQLTSFIGREKEMAEVKQFLSATRLLTLTGSGGCGKTRLALQVAADLLEEYPDGVWLVELAALADPALVPQTVASALGVREAEGTLWEGRATADRPLTAVLTQHLRPKSLLLVLDNCEHLLPACAQLADSMLRACPNLRILASSREGLGITGERTYPVPSLSLPGAPGVSRQASGTSKGAEHPKGEGSSDWRLASDASWLMQFEAVRLFVERAAFTQPSFVLTDQNAPAVAQLCHRLDGIPLAIELAAARVKALSVEKLNERLDDMFRLLTGGSRTALPRQQTLRALIDWSYDLLSPSEQALLRTLSVFAGGWTLEAAEAVCSGPEDGGAAGVGPGPGRQKAESSGTGYAAEPGAAAESSLPTAFCLLPTDVLDLLTSLVEKSLVLYEEQGREGRYRLLETIRQYARDRLFEMGEAAMARSRHAAFFLRLAEEEAPTLWPRRAETAASLDRVEREQDNLRAALGWYLAESRTPPAEDREGSPAPAAAAAQPAGLPPAFCLLPSGAEAGLRLAVALHGFWVSRARESEGREALAALLERAAEAPTDLRARALGLAGDLAALQQAFGEARPLVEESLALFREMGDAEGISTMLNVLGWMALSQRDFASAYSFFEERGPEADARSPGCYGRASVATAMGDYATARALLQEGLAYNRKLGDKADIAMGLWRLARVARAEGEDEEARAHYEASLSLAREIEFPWMIATSLTNLAQIALQQDNPEDAGPLARESLMLWQKVRDNSQVVCCLECLAQVASADTQPERTARLLGAAAALSEGAASKEDPERVRHASMARAALGEEAFAAAWAEGRAMSLERALAYALEGSSEPA